MSTSSSMFTETETSQIDRAQRHARSLAGEGVFLPRQSYSRTLDELRQQLARHLASNSHISASAVMVVTDGRSKLCRDAPHDIDASVRQILDSLSCRARFVNLSDALGVSIEDLHASSLHLPALAALLNDADVVIALGSGTLTDLVKHALFSSRPHTSLVSIPTALTVTAFTSAFSVLDWNGAKSTKPSKCPDAVLWVEPFLAQAPQRLSQAGFGDLLALFLAQGDWYLAHSIGMSDSYSDVAPRLVAPFLEDFTKAAESFSRPCLSPDAVETSAAVLSLAGLGMTLSGATTPVSGAEHAVSHGLDFLRLATGRPLLLHGAQVALASLAVAQCLDEVIAIPEFDLRRWRKTDWIAAREVLRALFASAPLLGSLQSELSPQASEERIAEIAAPLRLALEHFEEEYSQKHERWSALHPRMKEILKEWPHIRTTLASLTLRAKDVESLIQRAGLPLAPEATDPVTTADELRWALRFAPFVRARMNLGDFVFWMGADPAWLAGL